MLTQIKWDQFHLKANLEYFMPTKIQIHQIKYEREVHV